MKFIVSSSYLLKQLQVLGGIINNNNTLPILDNFLFDLDGNALTVSASDLETTIASNLEVESSEKGIVCIPARLLLDTLKTFPEQPLTFTIEDNNTVEISSNHGKYALAYAPGDEFPSTIELKDPSSTILQGDILATAISKTIFASGNDDLRPVMSGVFFQFSTEGLTFVATDAHKLVRYRRLDTKSEAPASFILPKNLKVEFHGTLSLYDVYELYNSCEYAIYPSLVESFGLPLIEATNHGCKVIASDLPYVHEIIEPSLTFDPYSVESISNSILKAIETDNLPETKVLVENKLDNFINFIISQDVQR